MAALAVLACGGPTPIPSVKPSLPAVSPSSSTGPVASGAARSQPADTAVNQLLGAMTTDQKIGQLFMVSFFGDQANEAASSLVASNRDLLGTDAIGDAIAKYHLGGVIYFDDTGNMVSAAQVATLSNAIQAAGAAQSPAIPLLISTDQEGGEIVRLPAPATQFPGNMALGATRSSDLARGTAADIGAELQAVGINQDLAPDGDVNVNAANPVIGVRSFGSDADLVATLTPAMVAGFQDDARVAATVKHFPGHGDTDIDSHSQLPTINHSLAQWQLIDEPPFTAAIAAGVDALMVGHLAVPALDATATPASLSQPIVTGVLRDQLGFDGLVMTDALNMGALRDGFGDARIPVLAVLAGDDLLLMPPSLPIAFTAVQSAVASGEISTTRLNQSVRRILELKQALGLFGAAPTPVAAAASALGTRSHLGAQQRDAESSVTLLANDGGVLPLTASSAGPYLVVGPASASVTTLVGFLRSRGLSVSTLITGVSPPPSMASVAAARTADVGTVIDLTLDADTDSGQQRVVTALAGSSTRLVTVSISRPYDQAYYRAAVNLCLYSSSTASLDALVRVLFGEIDPIGRLPVAIPDPSSSGSDLYPFGFGLGY